MSFHLTRLRAEAVSSKVHIENTRNDDGAFDWRNMKGENWMGQ